MMTPSRRHSGFTLIEVLIALGLSVMLISAVYAAVDLYYRYQVAGRAEIRGQQLMRSLTRLIAQDIGSVVLQTPEPASSSTSSGQAADTTGSSSSSTGTTGGSSSTTSGGTGSTGSSSSSTGSSGSGTSSSDTSSQSGTEPAITSGTALSFLGLEEAGLPIVFGVVGTEELLHLTVSLPSRDLNYMALSDTSIPEDRIGDLQLVTIGLTSIDSLSMTMLQKNLKTTRPGVGLGRRVRDLYSVAASDETLEAKHLLAPEVTEVGFRYFDSGEWFGSWDSVTMGRLPRAIEVDFGFWNPPAVQVGRAKSLDPGIVTHVQYVFKVPLSAPTVQ